MALFRFLAWRTAGALVLVFAVASGAMLLAQLAPGDFASSTIEKNPEFIAAERHRLGLDRPIGERYIRWAGRMLSLDFGDSLYYQQPVAALVLGKAANTAVLAATALAVATFLGIPCGIVTGSRRGVASWLLRAVSLVLLSVPPLISSLVLLTIAAATGWLPVSGMDGPRNLVVPTLALALPVAAMLERIQSQAIADALERPSALAARARGVPAFQVVWRHAWRQSLAPIFGIYGVIVGSLFSGSFVVEYVTSWPGLAELMRQALIVRDTELVAGCAAAGAAFLAAGLLASDIAHALSDPRVVFDGASHA